MSLTAKEWLLLPEDEQIKRADEVPPHECFLLRVLYAEVHFTEEQKANITQEERDEFLRDPTEEEILRGKHASFDAMKMFEMIPEEVTFEEWQKAGCHVGWRKKKRSYDL